MVYLIVVLRIFLYTRLAEVGLIENGVFRRNFSCVCNRTNDLLESLGTLVDIVTISSKAQAREANG